MSRRKQLHPKSTKGEDVVQFVLPTELKYDEQTNAIISGVNLAPDHHFRSFTANLQIEDRIGAFHLLDNRLAPCSGLNQSSTNLQLICQNKQLTVMVKESIPAGTRLHSNQLIFPMNQEIQIKEEPSETKMKQSSTVGFRCDTCGIRFRKKNSLNIHREHYCIEHNARTSHSTESTDSTGIKRQSTDHCLIKSAKRVSKESHSSGLSKLDRVIRQQFDASGQLNKKDNQTIPFTHPIQIGQFIYVPIPLSSTQIENKPLDLSQTKKRTLRNENQIRILQEKFYQCEFCSIHFRSFQTLQAHQENYCLEYQKLKSTGINSSPILTCRSCNYRANTRRAMQIHFYNNKFCSEDDFCVEPNVTNLFLPKCTICLAMFDDEEALLNHIKCVHINSRLIECLECRSRFRSKWNLIRHMKLLHTNIKSDKEDKNRQSTDSINLITENYSSPSRFSQFNTLPQQMNKSSIERKNDNITYCSTCDIPFQHRTSYQAHKMYYCRERRLI